MLEPNGYVIFGDDEAPAQSEEVLAVALAAAGLAPWTGDGLPRVVLLQNHGSKSKFFEAGYWLGRGVPLIFVGSGERARKRASMVKRFTGWVALDDAANLPEVLEKLGLKGGA
jgi:hypothetical protein